ncbi:MAG: type VI secretion system contractile sheath large subunit, partial [Sedimentitalea sp.]
LEALLADVSVPDTVDAAIDKDLDDMLADDEPDGLLSETETEEEDVDLDDLLADDDLEGLLSDIETSEDPDLADVDLDDLIVEPETSEASDPDVSDSTDDDLDGLLSDIETPEAAETSETDLDDLLADVDLDGLLSQDADPDTADADFDNSELDVTLNTDGLGEDAQGDSDQPSEVTQGAQGNEHDQDPSEAGETVMRTGSAGLSFGAMSADRPAPQQLVRKRFRLAIFGDFSARSARGVLETGDDLAARAPIPLDPDTVEDVIESFATTLILPIGKDGAGIEIKLGGLDDLHPDELYENVELFSELAGLKTQLASGATADHAAKQLRAWGEAHGTPAAPARLKSSATSVPANLRLSDFQKLIGDASGRLSQASPMDEMLARVVGPHIRAVPDADTQAMQAAVDQALSAAMRLVLHHPEFQAVESQWRSLDLIARSIETDNTLDVVLYDVSAEEIAADLAQSEDLAQSGLARLLSDGPLDPETGRGGYSALIGLYGFEETPPHAEVLARIARVAAHVDAPFFGAMSPAFLETAKDDRHPLVAKAWDTLREMPEARHLGLATPRFMLRRPYGAKSEPIYEFEFEEFTMEAGLSGMLWANPVVLVAILLARSFRENGAHMDLGSIMSLGDIPFHYVKDRYGDQVALPCTERNLTLDKIETVMARGFMPLASIKGRDEIRLTSFQALGGGEILGPWSKETAPPPSAAKPTPAPAPQAETEDAPDEDLDALLAGLDDEPDAGDDDDFDLDALLSEFDDEVSDDDDMDTADDTGLDDIDAELAALLEDL